jgi:hypothetical protein
MRNPSPGGLAKAGSLSRRIDPISLVVDYFRRNDWMCGDPKQEQT